MVATSLAEPEVASSPSLYARIHQALKPKSPANDVQASHLNEDSSRTGQGSANAQDAGPIRFFPCYSVPCDDSLFPIR